LLKETSERELRVFEAIQSTPLASFAPAFYGEENGPADADKRLVHIRMQDLTAGMRAPCVMDIKMGTRTFLESEVSNQKPRHDLVEKMVKLDPTGVTEQERAEGVTKLRYMQYRERLSSTSTHGWRIDGMRITSGADGKTSSVDTKLLRTNAELRDAIEEFLQRRRAVHASCLARLRALMAALESSELYSSMEMVGSSILFVYDGAGEVAAGSVHMIDFAKTTMPLPGDTTTNAESQPSAKTAETAAGGKGCARGVGGRRLTHTEPWVLGNQEDGHLHGLRSLIRMWETIDARAWGSSSSEGGGSSSCGALGVIDSSSIGSAERI